MKIQATVINFAVYEDKTEFMGIASVQLPDLTALSQQISGAGIAGNIEAIIPGHFEAMTCTINFRTTTTAALKLSEPRRHNLDIRVANQVEDTVAGKVAAQSVKHVLVVLPKKDGGGTLAPASAADASGEYAVRYWATYVDGQKIREIDPMNSICIINGVDYLADVRKALGK